MFNPCRLVCRGGILSLILCASTGLSADIAENFAREAIYEDVLISPSGKYLAVVYRSEGEEFLSVLDRSSSKHLSKLGFGDRMGIIDVVWANDERLLIWPAQRFWYSDSKMPTGEIIGINANGKKHKRLFGWQAGDTFARGRLEGPGAHLRLGTAGRHPPQRRAPDPHRGAQLLG